MGQIAHGDDFRHARSAFERVQVALQGRQRQRVLRVVQPAMQGFAGAIENIHRLFKEDFDDFLIKLVGGFSAGWRRGLLGQRWAGQGQVGQRLVRQLRGGRLQLGDAQRVAAVAFDQAHGARVEALLQQFAQALDTFRAGIHFLAGGDLVEHVDQPFVSAFGLIKKALADRQTAFFHGAVQVQQCFAQFIDLRQIGKMRAVAEGGQFIEQRTQFLTLARMLPPALQQVFGVEQNVHALFQKAGNQLRITLLAYATVRRVERVLQAFFEQSVSPIDQRRSAVDGGQGFTVELRQPLIKQGFGRAQQFDFRRSKVNHMRLELTNQLIQRVGQLGNRQHTGHVGAALQRMQRPLQVIANGGDIIGRGAVEEPMQGIQVPARFLAENLQQLRVQGFFCSWLGGNRLADGVQFAVGTRLAAHAQFIVATGRRQRMGARGQQVDIVALMLHIFGEIPNDFGQ